MIMGIFLVVLFALLIANMFSNSTFFCDVMGWHRMPKNVGFDGCSHAGVCPRCGKEVLQDSNGDWFH